jgi:hypothetical protein
MKKLMMLALAASALCAAPSYAKSGAANPTATHDNPSSCLGAERATRNSNGGDRAQGEFGQEQAAYVAYINSGASQYMSYGEFLQAWKAACTNAPGGGND